MIETPKERAQRDREKREFLDSLPLREAYRTTFEHQSGREVLAHIIEISHQDDTTFTGNSLGMFHEGARAFVLMLKRIIPRIFAEVELDRAIAKENEMNRAMAEAMKPEQEKE